MKLTDFYSKIASFLKKNDMLKNEITFLSDIDDFENIFKSKLHLTLWIIENILKAIRKHL